MSKKRSKSFIGIDVSKQLLDEDEAESGERGGHGKENLVAADAARGEEDMEYECDHHEGHRDHQLLRTEAGCLRRGHGDRSGDPERGDPEEQAELRPTPRDGDHPAPFSIRSAMRPMASSSPK